MVSLRCDTETKSPIAQEGRSVFLAFVGVFELFKRKNKTSKGNGLTGNDVNYVVKIIFSRRNKKVELNILGTYNVG